MITRLGLYSGARGLYGSFTGKVTAPPVVGDTLVNEQIIMM